MAGILEDHIIVDVFTDSQLSGDESLEMFRIIIVRKLTNLYFDSVK